MKNIILGITKHIDEVLLNDYDTKQIILFSNTKE